MAETREQQLKKARSILKTTPLAKRGYNEGGFPTGEPEEGKRGFLQSLVQGITNVPRRLAVEAYNVTKGVSSAVKTFKEEGLRGDYSEANAELDKERDLGYLGVTKPTLTNSSQPGPKELLDVGGQGVEAGSFFVGGGASKELIKNTAKQTFKQLVKQGAKEGGIIGATTGFGQSLQEEEQSIKNTLLDTAGGALAGGVLGAATGGLSSKLKTSSKASNKADDFVQDLVSPKATKQVQERALSEGRVTEAGLLKKSRILPSKKDKQIAEIIKPYVSSKKSITENIDSVTFGVKEINQGVKEYVKVNKVPFNANQLKTQLNKGKDELNLVFASDTNAQKTYDAVVEEFMRHVNKKDTAGLMDARQAFDKIPAIKKLLDSQGLGENTKKEVVLTVRSMANQYIARLLPQGNKYREQLLQESKMIEAIGNMVEKNISMIGKNKLQQLTIEYPLLKWIVSGLAGAGGIGVGSVLIGSSD